MQDILEAIDTEEEEKFVKSVSKFTKITQFDKVKNQLVVKIKELYLPDANTLGG